MSTYNKNKLLTFEISSRSRFCYLNSLKKFEVGLYKRRKKEWKHLLGTKHEKLKSNNNSDFRFKRKFIDAIRG
jgi:hypothetical protein